MCELFREVDEVVAELDKLSSVAFAYAKLFRVFLVLLDWHDFDSD